MDGEEQSRICCGRAWAEKDITEKGSGYVFQKIFQEAGYAALFREMSFWDALGWMMKNKTRYVKDVLNVK